MLRLLGSVAVAALILVVACVVLAPVGAFTARGAEAPGHHRAASDPAAGCAFRYDDQVAWYAARHAPLAEVAPAELPALLATIGRGDPATRGFVVVDGPLLLLGLEVGGCLQRPIDLRAAYGARAYVPGHAA